MKIGIIGENGMLGHDVSTLFKSRGYRPEIYNYPEFDVTRCDDLQKVVENSDIIINCAAYTAVDLAESDVENCYAINSKAVENLGNT